MIHLSRFVVGIRHNRVFRTRGVSGELIDEFVKKYPDIFTQVDSDSVGNEFELKNEDSALFAKITIDDIIVENIKKYDSDKQGYVEVNKRQVLKIAKECLPIVTEKLGLEKDFVRIGMIFEFRVPSFEGIENGNFRKFIYEKFIDFETEGEKSEGNLRFVYKLKVPEGGHIKKVKDFRNIILNIKQSKGVSDKGKTENCLFISVDIQRIIEPAKKMLDVEEHYNFAEEHLKQVVIPALKSKGIEINYE